MNILTRNKFFLVLLLFIIVLFVVTACGGNQEVESDSNDNASESNEEGNDTSSTGDKPVLGIAAIDLTNTFFIQMKEAGEQADEDYGVTSIWQSADNSVENQITIIENFIQQEVDVILIDPLDKNAVIPAIEKAEEAGIPVITMGNKVEAGWNYSTLYPDYENMAMSARVLGTALDGEGQIALLTLSKGNYVSDQREAGFLETMEEEFPNIEIVGNQPTDFDTAEAQRITETWLQSFPDLDAIATIDDSLAIAAMSTAESMGKDIPHTGYAGIEETFPFIDEGQLLVDSLLGSYRVGYWNIAAAARIANGADFPKDLKMPTYFISSDETAQMLADKGLDLDYITTGEAKEIFDNYAEEFGPDVSDEWISGQ